MSTRGARSSRGGRPDNLDYNAMEEHYNSENNSYVTNSGAEVKYERNREGKSGIKLHITNIPSSLSEDGLKNVFISEGFEPSDCYIGAKNKNAPGDTKWGFITLKNIADGQSAIYALHRKPPHSLNVKFAMSDEEKLNKKNKNDKDRDSDSDKNSSMSMLTRGRGQLPPMQGKSPSEFRSTRASEEPFFNDVKPNDRSGNKFSHPESNYDDSNAVHSPYADGYYEDDGTRKMSMGRGSYIGSIDNSRDNSSNPNHSRFQYHEIPDDMDTKVAAYISKKFKDLSVEENFKISSNVRLTMPFKLGSCNYCSRPSIYCCSRCKVWYCSNSCREDDYPDHRNICSPRTLVFGKDGNVSFSNDSEQFVDADRPTSLMDVSLPRSNYVKSPNKNDYSHEPNGFGHRDEEPYMNKGERMPREMNRSRDNPKDSHRQNQRDFNRDNPKESNRQNPRDSNRENPRGKPRDSREHQRDNRENMRDNRDKQRDSRDDCEFGGDNQRSSKASQRNSGRDSTGNRGNRYSNPDNNSLDFNQETKRNSHGGRNDRRGGRDQRQGNDVYVRSLMSPQETSKVNKSFRDEPPIPEDRYTEVTIGSICKDTSEFYGFSELDYAAQGELMNEVIEFQDKANAYNIVNVGDVVGAPFSDAWFRAEVTNVGKSTVEVFFVDFGNEATIEKSDLRCLPKSIIQKAPLAHKFKLCSSPDNPPLSEETQIKVKPIRQGPNKTWIVRVEGVPYPDLDEVY